MSLVDESSIDWTLLEYNMYVYVYLFIYLCIYLFTYLIKSCWTCWGLRRNDVANQIYCTVFHEAISFCNISRDNHLHQGFIAPRGDKTWLVACPNLRHVGSRDWPGRPSQNGTCNVEKIWKSFRITFRYEEWIIYGYVPNQRMFSPMSGLHSLQTNEENYFAAPCCVETTISHPGFHWDCIEIESWLIPMSTMAKAPYTLGKQCRFDHGTHSPSSAVHWVIQQSWVSQHGRARSLQLTCLPWPGRMVGPGSINR